MNILYAITVILLLLVFLKIKKSDNKLNGLVWITYSIGLLFCFNTLVVWINYLIGIISDFLSLSVINIVISIFIYLLFIKKKKCQKYYFSKKELLIMGLISLVLFIICYFRYDGFTRIAYSISDASIHYYLSNDFANTGIINGMPIFQINCGLFIKINSFLTPYISYNIFNTFMLIILTNTFLITCFEFTKKIKYRWFIIIALLYGLGYPLNYVLFGFGYLGIGILIINLIVITLYLFLERKEYNSNKNILMILIMFLLNFGLFFSYYLFVPMIFLSVGLYYIYKWISKQITLKELLVLGIITLIIPFLIGVIYFILPQFIYTNENIFTDVGIAGDCFLNMINIIILIPFVLIVIKNNIKNKKNLFVSFLYIITILFLALLSILIFFKISSSYYCSKLYFVLWLLSFIVLLNYKYKKNHNIFIALFVAFFSLYTGFEVQRLNRNALIPRVSYDIYFYNYNDYVYKLTNPGIYVDEIELMNKTKKYDDICETKDIFVSTAGVYYNYWMYAFTKYKPNYLEDKYRDIVTINNMYVFDYDYWKSDDEYKCLIYFKRSALQPDLSEYTVLYKNTAGSIIKK